MTDGGAKKGMDEERPTQLPLAGPATALFGGNKHTCARLADQRLFCWGALAKRQLDIAGTECSAGLFAKTELCVDPPSQATLPTKMYPLK